MGRDAFTNQLTALIKSHEKFARMGVRALAEYEKEDPKLMEKIKSKEKTMKSVFFFFSFKNKFIKKTKWRASGASSLKNVMEELETVSKMMPIWIEKNKKQRNNKMAWMTRMDKRRFLFLFLFYI